jgi:GTP pyrophosphokinase
MKDITAVLSDAGVNIVSATLKTTKEGVAVFNFIFEIGNTSILDKIIQNLKTIDNVFDAYRV